jgi:hypothetical protein
MSVAEKILAALDIFLDNHIGYSAIWSLPAVVAETVVVFSLASLDASPLS